MTPHTTITFSPICRPLPLPKRAALPISTLHLAIHPPQSHTYSSPHVSVSVCLCHRLLHLRHRRRRGALRRIRVILLLCTRTVFLSAGFPWVTVRGRRASAREAPIITMAPHSSYFDVLPVIVMSAPSVVAKIETSRAAMFGSKRGSIRRTVYGVVMSETRECRLARSLPFSCSLIILFFLSSFLL